MDYTQVGLVEREGRYELGVRIEVSAKHPLSDSEKNEICSSAYRIANELQKGAERNDPEVVQALACERQQILGCFPAGCCYEIVPNEYSMDSSRPWLKVHTTRGPFIVGWRKRVIELKWSGTVAYKNIPFGLFDGEDVTKSEAIIHAWSYDKLRDYVNRLMTCELQRTPHNQ